MGGRAWIMVFCLLAAGCSCGAMVIDSSAGHGGRGGDAGVPPTKPSGTGGVPSSVDSGPTVAEPDPADAADAGEDLIEPRSGSVLDVKGVSTDGHPAIVQSVRDKVHGVDCSA